MDIRSYLQIFFALLVMFGVLPYFAILINAQYSLPVYSSTFTSILGYVLLLFGFSIIVHCAKMLFFDPNQEIPLPTLAPERFIVDGLYRYVRNPMYIGYFVVILSEFLVFGHILILAYLVTIGFFVNLAVIYKEERELEKKFGTDYINYKNKVPRWLPRFSRK